MKEFIKQGLLWALHRAVIEKTGGMSGIRDLGALDSALAQPGATFDGVDLHPSLADKAAVLCLSLVRDHPFLDANKRVGHAAKAAETAARNHYNRAFQEIADIKKTMRHPPWYIVSSLCG